MWWRGNGQVILWLACLPAFGAAQLGARQVALAFAFSAVMIFVARDWIGAESSLYSIPTRMWPPLLLLVALLAHFAPQGKNSSEPNAERAAARSKTTLPVVLEGTARIDRSVLEGKTLLYEATSAPGFDRAAGRADLERKVRMHYCKESRELWEAGVGIDFRLMIPPPSLSERLQTHAFTLAPALCK